MVKKACDDGGPGRGKNKNKPMTRTFVAHVAVLGTLGRPRVYQEGWVEMGKCE